MSLEVCRAPDECSLDEAYVAPLFSTGFALVTVVSLVANLQAYLWWRDVKTSYFALSVKLALLASSALVRNCTDCLPFECRQFVLC